MLTACATKDRAVASSEAPKVLGPALPALPAHALAAVPAKEAHGHAPGATAHEAFPSVEPTKALGWLKNGNLRFVKQGLRKDGQSKKDRERLAKGQHPHSIVVSCSDSRVPPELVFDQKLGEIFTVRTAGESLDFSAIASIEYAVSHLGAKLIVVMGHESCGAVKAALETPEGKTAGSADLDKLVADIRPRLSNFTRQPASAGVVAESTANAQGAAQDLLKRSAILRDKVAKGEVVIKSALYHLGSGAVSWTN